MKRDATDIILRPLLTEKVSGLQETLNLYAFEVRKDANKVEIKLAVQKLFNVHVDDVKTLVTPGKWKRLGRSTGRTTGTKKAIVTLRQGDRIELFEGV